MDELAAVVNFIRQNDDITVVAHIAPDGDCLGSALALTHALQRMGKRARAVCADPVPHIYAFLPGASAVLAPQNLEAPSAAFAVDCADAMRMGAAAKLFAGAKRTCSIDHHGTNTAYAGINHVEDSASATGEIVFRLFELMGVSPDAQEACCLYTALMTDTGNFAYSNTTPETFRIAGMLRAAGADNSAINRLVYRTVPLHKQKLLGAALVKTELFCDGLAGVACITLEDMAAVGATGEDTDGIVESIRDIEGVEIAITIRETPDDGCKVSFRSKEYANVGDIAVRLGGGGHVRAAGCTVRENMETVRSTVLELVKETLKR